MAATDDKSDDFVIQWSSVPEDTPWWQADVEKVLEPETRKMLETYSGILPDEVVSHIKNTQKRSWDVSPFASVGAMTWLNPYILLHPAYKDVLTKVKDGGTILDCACMIAPDLRQLAYDGAPTDRMYGCDLQPEFFNIGYDFYKDKEKFKGKFFQADATEPFGKSELGSLVGNVDVIWAAKFIHIFERGDQIKMMAKLVSLLKPQKGSMFVGSQNGYPGGVDIPVSKEQKFASQTDKLWLADAPDMEEMWQEVAKRTGTEWDMKAYLLDLRTIGLHEDDGTPYKRYTGYNLQWVATRK